MNFGPCVDPPEVLGHCNLTQVHSLRHVFLFGVFRTTSRNTGVLSCVVLKRWLDVGTTEEMLPFYFDEHVEEPYMYGQTAKLAMLNLQRHIVAWCSKPIAFSCGRRARANACLIGRSAGDTSPGQSPLRCTWLKIQRVLQSTTSGIMKVFSANFFSRTAISARGISTT